MKSIVNNNIPSSNEGIQTPPPAPSKKSRRAKGETGPDAGLQRGPQPDIRLAVHILSDDSTCKKCGSVIDAGEISVQEYNGATCLQCAGLDHLVFLESGNATLTGRAVKQFGRRIIVQRIYKTRPARRWGVLVDQQAIDRAQALCVEDAEKRAQNRVKQVAHRMKKDEEFAGKFAEKIGILCPNCPADERLAIAQHACSRGSGRVGRSASGQQLDDQAIKLAVIAHIRHVHTNYENLVYGQTEREWVRELVKPQIDAIYNSWLPDTKKIEGE
jgi:hypothetical protein